MKVKDALTAVFADIGDETPAIGKFRGRGRDLLDHVEQGGPNPRRLGIADPEVSDRVGHMTLGNDEHVLGSPWIDVPKRQDVVGVDHHRGRNLPGDHLAEQAVWLGPDPSHSGSVMARRTVARSERTNAARNSRSLWRTVKSPSADLLRS